MRWLKISTLRSCSQQWDFFLPPTKYADKYVFLLLKFFELIYTAYLMPSLGWNCHLGYVPDKNTLISVYFYDYPVFIFFSICRKISSSSAFVGSWIKRPLAYQKKHCIFQLELHRLICLIPLSFHHILPYLQQIIKCDYSVVTNCLYHFSGILSHPQLCQKLWYINSHWKFLPGGWILLPPSIHCLCQPWH